MIKPNQQAVDLMRAVADDLQGLVDNSTQYTIKLAQLLGHLRDGRYTDVLFCVKDMERMSMHGRAIANVGTVRLETMRFVDPAIAEYGQNECAKREGLLVADHLTVDGLKAFIKQHNAQCGDDDCDFEKALNDKLARLEAC